MLTLPKKVKRPPNSFMIFRAEKSRELKDQHGIESQGMVSGLAARMWAQIDPQTKAEYEAKAEVKKAEHFRANPGYVYRPMSKEEKEAQKKKAAKERPQNRRRRRKDTHPYPPSQCTRSSAASTSSSSSTPNSPSSLSVQTTIPAAAVNLNPYFPDITSYLEASQASQNQHSLHNPYYNIQTGRPAPRGFSGDQQDISTARIAREPTHENPIQEYASVNIPPIEGPRTPEFDASLANTARNGVEPPSMFDYSNIDPALLSLDEPSNSTPGDSNANFHLETPPDLCWDDFLTDTGLHALQGDHEARPSSVESGYEVYPPATVENTRLPPVDVPLVLDAPDGTTSTRPIFNKQSDQRAFGP
ncbi:mating type protein [Moniliophthora roreri]|uniref:HMG box domain-containing protein n=1 Tax=Moniliophthora roreri TaxID=221103 RepID=A0A0W0FRG6_MONRR|nr:mating type protein [Moniliophthora roreri]